jgi:hypothetical protein
MFKYCRAQLFATFCLLFISMFSFAQDDEVTETRSRVGMYGVAGLNLSKFRDDASSESLTGFNGGLGFAAFVGKKGNNLSLEVSYSQNGSKLVGGTLATHPKQLRLNYIQIPVMFRYAPFKQSSFYLALGAQPSFYVGGHAITMNDDKYTLKEEMLTKTTFDANAAAGIRFGPETVGGLEVRYQYGLAKVFESSTSLRTGVVQFRLYLPLGFVSEILNSMGGQ